MNYLLYSLCLASSVNQPNLCPSSTWYVAAPIYINSIYTGVLPNGVFVDVNNTLYLANWANDRVYIFNEGNQVPDKTLTLATGFDAPLAAFATYSGDIYVDNGWSFANILLWPKDTTANTTTKIIEITEECYDLFIDISNTIYCAATVWHQILRKWLPDTRTGFNVAAGTVAGSGASQLNLPKGIFVDANFAIYVADSVNNRIQKFTTGQVDAITVAGTAAPGTIALTYPTDIMLDANGYMFIVDSGKDRIIAQGPYGFRCIFGCAGTAGSGTSQLNDPRSFSFDSYGNIYVANANDPSVKKIVLASNSCSMFSLNTHYLTYCVVFFRLGLSYNEPTFCTNAAWNSTATIFATSTVVGSSPNGIFINGINTVYMTNTASNLITISKSGETTNTIISSGLSSPFSVFMSFDGDVYIDNGLVNGRVDKFTMNSNTSVPAMTVSSACYDLFIDQNNYLYCSLTSVHQVVRVLLSSGSTTTSVVAGTGSSGNTATTFNSQKGIYIDDNSNLYVADSGNNRIQTFASGQTSGTTVDTGPVTLNNPTDVVVDKDGYLFIVDSSNHRIIGSDANGFRCIVACSGSAGTSTSDLSSPSSLSFDSFGNLYVIDINNSRVVKYTFQTTSCP